MNNFQVAALAAAQMFTITGPYPTNGHMDEFDKWADHILDWIEKQDKANHDTLSY